MRHFMIVSLLLNTHREDLFWLSFGSPVGVMDLLQDHPCLIMFGILLHTHIHTHTHHHLYHVRPRSFCNQNVQYSIARPILIQTYASSCSSCMYTLTHSSSTSVLVIATLKGSNWTLGLLVSNTN